VIPQISQKLTEKLLLSMPNHQGTIHLNGQNLPLSFMELSKPTGKYVYRIFMKLFNLFSRKGYIRVVGNTCAPGLIFPNIPRNSNSSQFIQSENSCGVLVANVLGTEKFTNATTILAEPFMLVKIDPNLQTLKDYFNQFSSKYRVRAQKVLKNSHEIEFKTLNNYPSNDWISQCGKLLYHSLQNKTIAIGQNLSELIHCYQKTLGNQFKVHGYFLEGHLVGFISYIEEDNHIHATHLGIDENLPLTYSLYQRMMYDLIEYGILNQKHTINIGRTATEIKSTLGAVPIENSFVLFTKSKSLRFLMNLYANQIHKAPHYTLRNPFKTSEIH
jgi:hypothetical protein